MYPLVFLRLPDAPGLDSPRFLLNTLPKMANEEDLDLVCNALAGDPAACNRIGGDEMCGWITGVLVKRGATPTEAADITADVFGDCFGRNGKKEPLLPPLTWATT